MRRCALLVALFATSAALAQSYLARPTAEGAKVLVADIQEEPGAAAAREVKGTAVRVDVTSPEETRAMAARAAEVHGTMDILVNNAGMSSSIQKRPFFEIPVEECARASSESDFPTGQTLNVDGGTWML